jgi:hypothetical protein
VRIASFNVGNLFQRAKALNPDTREENKPILEKQPPAGGPSWSTGSSLTASAAGA